MHARSEMMSSPDCFDFVRSLPLCHEHPSPDASNSVRKQFNEISAFVDASNVYGSDIKHHLSLRVEGTPYLKVS